MYSCGYFKDKYFLSYGNNSRIQSAYQQKGYRTNMAAVMEVKRVCMVTYVYLNVLCIDDVCRFPTSCFWCLQCNIYCPIANKDYYYIKSKIEVRSARRGRLGRPNQASLETLSPSLCLFSHPRPIVKHRLSSASRRVRGNFLQRVWQQTS